MRITLTSDRDSDGELEEHYEDDFHDAINESISSLNVEDRKHAFSAPQEFSQSNQPPPKTALITPRGEMHTPEVLLSAAGNHKLMDWGNFFCSPFRSPCVAVHPSSNPNLSPGFIERCAPLLKITPKFRVKRPQGRIPTPPTIAAMSQYLGSPLLPSWAIGVASASRSLEDHQNTPSKSLESRPQPPHASSPIKIPPAPAAEPLLQPLPPALPPSSRPMSRFYRQSKQQPDKSDRSNLSKDPHDSKSQADPPTLAFIDLKQKEQTMTAWALPKLPPLQSLVFPSKSDETGLATGRFSFALVGGPSAFDVTARLVIDPSSEYLSEQNQEAGYHEEPELVDLTLRPTFVSSSIQSVALNPLALRPSTSLNVSKLATRREPLKLNNPNSTLTLCPRPKVQKTSSSILSPPRSGSRKNNKSKGKESMVKTLAPSEQGQPPHFCIVNSLVKKLPPARFADFSAPRERSPNSKIAGGSGKSTTVHLPQIDKKLLSGSSAANRASRGKENLGPDAFKQAAAANCRPPHQMLESILASGPDSDFSFAPLPPSQEHQRTARMLLGSFEKSAHRRIR